MNESDPTQPRAIVPGQARPSPSTTLTHRILLGVVIVSVAAISLGGMWMVVADSAGNVMEGLMQAGVVTIIAALMLLANMQATTTTWSRVMGLLGSIGAVVGAALLYGIIWLGETPRYVDSDLFLPRAAATAGLVALGGTLAANLVTLRSPRFLLMLLRHVTVSLVGAELMLVILFIWEVVSIEDPNGWGPSPVFFFGALPGGVTMLVLILLTPFLFRMAGKKAAMRKESMSQSARLSFACPSCRSPLVLPTGLGRCKSCRQVLVIDVEEPRCECGYLLYRLAGTVCPECGRDAALAAASPGA